MTFVLVTGMHRSGTSLATSMLQAAGYDLGDPEQMLPADDANPNGFYEQWPIVRLNEHLLELHGGSWDDPPDLEPQWWQAAALTAERQRGRDAIEEVFGTDLPARAAVKDPRFCLTLPFWLDLVEVDHVVHVVREPAAVAASLASRDDMAPEDAGVLWLRHVAALVTATAGRGAPSLLTLRHEDLLRDPLPTLAGVLDQVGGPGVPDWQRAVEPLVDPTLWRQRDTAPQHAIVALAQQVAAGLGGDEPDAVLALVAAQSRRAGQRRDRLAQAHATASWELREASEQAASLERERDAILSSKAWRLGSAVTSTAAKLRPDRRREGASPESTEQGEG